MSKFSLLISTKNRVDDLLYTLKETAHLIGNNLNCVVIDDGSIDNTFEKLQSSFPKIEVSKNETSKGYMFCRNKMLNETKADFAISLDDDANIISENPIEIIEDYFTNNPKCGVIAARIYWNDNEPQTILTAEKPQIVQSFVGCGHVWRMKAWNAIPNYPEWFEFYGEENFASKQLYKKGWEVHYVPQFLVHHRVNLKNRSITNKDSSIRYENALRADWYNYLLFLPISKIPRQFAYSVWIQLKSKVFKGNFKILKSMFLVQIAILKNFSKLIKNRNSFSQKEYNNFYQLKPAKIFWKPEK